MARHSGRRSTRPANLGREESTRPHTRERTRERILDGAVRAVARHGISKLGMGDVSESAGVSRATLYRYFPTREVLLDGLVAREANRFLQQVIDAMHEAPAGEERLGIVVEFLTRLVRDHPALQRLVESEPAHVLESLRARFPSIRQQLHDVLAPLLVDSPPVRNGLMTTEQITDWMTRYLISTYLFPDPRPEATARTLTAMYKALGGAPPSGKRRR